jgi:transposase InsO family protein
MCQALEVGKSGYYAALSRPASARERKRNELRLKIKKVHAESRCIYGSPRIFQELREQGVAVSENTVAKLMSAAKISSKMVKQFVPKTTDSTHAFPVAENVLERQFEADAPNQKWVADITYIATEEGWLYLAGVVDLYSRKVVGWSMSEHMKAGLVEDALKMALARRNPEKGMLHHSDRGSQYACGGYQNLMAAHGLRCSMSRTGNCYDNAVMESFWSKLKTELVYQEKYKTRAQARQSIFEYMEVFYNRLRRHSSLGYVSPEAFEARMN